MIKLLVSIGVVYITYPHDEYGWDTTDNREWSFSIITLENMISDTKDNWTRNSLEYLKPNSYNYAENVLIHLVGTEKYNQILRSTMLLNNINYEPTF